MSKKPTWKTGKTWEPEFTIPSGSVKLDMSEALSNFKGLPAGIMVQLASKKEGSFKSSLALHGLAEIQKMGSKVAFIDAESGVIGTKFFTSRGVSLDEDKWTYLMPRTGEEAFEMAEYYIKHDDYKGIVIDSIDSCQPGTIMDAEFGDANIGNHAKLVTQAVRKFKTDVRENQCILWLVNQMRVNITSMGARGHKTTGGDAIDFYSKLNIEMSKSKADSQIIGTDYIPLRLRIGRSKLGKSYVDVDSYALQQDGVDKKAELVDVAEQFNMLTRSGSWWKTVNPDTGEVSEEAIGQGIEAARAWVLDNEELILTKLHEDEEKE